jgi:ubiquinone biosynthesis protein COQ9
VRPKRWKPIVERMVWRMRGNGNIGDVMKDMMAQVRTPAGTEVQTKSIACAALR